MKKHSGETDGRLVTEEDKRSVKTVNVSFSRSVLSAQEVTHVSSGQAE